ncbi:MAG: hypothetical protein OEQ15_01720 [Nitrosopumilus sp.]|nr:hypothetical protein [Nitrosopumilus sp.]MDH3793471.1 hypothetical protein [Nitrosopumilus sp.]MDH3854517.1 hypothetical protein [Nitrosopumilus sp.]
MAKSLGDYNIERSSSSDVGNITWTQKTSTDVHKPKKKNPNKISQNIRATNIIFTETQVKSTAKKVFIIEEVVDTSTSKMKHLDRKFENSSASNCNIKQGFKRPAR